MTLTEIKTKYSKSLPKATICFLITDSNILLAMKKRGFGEGKWNGVGGKPNPGETIEETAVRECLEEIRVTPLNLKQVGSLSFYHLNAPEGKEWNQEVIVFTATDWEGVPLETEEMKPEWFSFAQIPYDKMWEDDRHWLPKILAGKNIKGEFLFGEDGNLKEFNIVDIL
jgi:8-oxo-dGTP pyrophosphatase MutT (NUDIX family)